MIKNLSLAIHDLDWVVKSPALVKSSITPVADSSQIVPDNTEALSQHLETLTSYRVGRYFESLVHFWLRSLPGFEIVEHQKQLFVDGRTVGEIDFLYRDQSGSMNHLETAVKFYLHFPGAHRSGSHFIGPNSRDHFEKKMGNLFEHQLKIGKEFFPEIVQSQAFIKGRIFYHPHYSPPVEIPDQLAANHLRGSWIYEDELDWLSGFASSSRFLLACKPHWLAESIAEKTSNKLKTIEQLRFYSRQHFLESRRPLLVSVHEPGENCFREISRFFIVQKNWPHE